MNQFNYTDQSNSFSKNIGNYTPDKYSYKPQLGDEIDIFKNIFNQHFEGVVVSINETPEFIKDLLKDEFGVYIEKEQIDFFDNKYFCWGNEWEGYINEESTDCDVYFVGEIKLTKSNIKNIFTDNKSIDDVFNEEVREINYRCETLSLKLTRIKNRNFKIEGFVRCFINGNSVITTKEVKDLKESYQSSEEIENVAWSDEIIDNQLKLELNQIIDVMCLKERKDYHPGSRKTVRDIVHPSLFCYVEGVSKIKNPKSMPKKLECGDMDFWGRQYEDSKYQWLPSEFFIEESGKVSINSYINNLDQNKYPQSYPLLANIFEKFVPMFEKVCSNLRNDFYGTESNHNGKAICIPLRNRNLQVVTKIVEYRVNKEENFDGVWHVEGMSHENIIATGLYIFKREENFNGAEIEFRRFLYEDEGSEIIYSTPQNANRQTDQMGGGDVKPLGRLETPEGRAIVFPNSHIHKLTNMVSADGKDAVRRILVFWLVNPDVKIVSSRDVAPQQTVMTFKEAKKYQLELMKERKLHKESFMEREVFLCEH